MLYARLLVALPFRIVGTIVSALLESVGDFLKSIGMSFRAVSQEIVYVLDTHEKDQRRIVRHKNGKERLKETAVRDIERLAK